MLSRRTIAGLISGFVLAAGAAMPAAAQGEVTVYCSVQEEWCRPMMQAFERATGIKVSMTRKSSGEFYAQIKAEAANPRGDIWWGGTATRMCRRRKRPDGALQVPDAVPAASLAVKQAEQTGFKTVGIYSGALGYGYNKEQIAKRKITPPACWADLVKPEFKDEVQVADPNSSGTAYTMLATLVQLMGEDKAFDYMKALHKNVNQYTRSGAALRAPRRRARRWSASSSSTTPSHRRSPGPGDRRQPLRGTGYEIGSMSIIKGAKNLENAKKFYDWALTAERPGDRAAGPVLPGAVQQGRAEPS